MKKQIIEKVVEIHGGDYSVTIGQISATILRVSAELEFEFEDHDEWLKVVQETFAELYKLL